MLHCARLGVWASEVFEGINPQGVEGCSQIVSQDGKPAGLHIIARDITESKRAEEALRLSELRYRALVEHAPEAIVVFDLTDGRMVDCNENAARLFRLPRKELLNVKPAQMSPPFQADGRPSPEAAREYLAQALEGKTPVFEWMHYDSAGRNFISEIRLARIPSERPLVRASITDISERKRTDADLRESEERFRQLSEASFEVIGFIEKGKILHANARLAEMVGWDLQDLIGAEVASFVAPESMDLVMAHVRAGSEEPYEHMAIRKDRKSTRLNSSH